MRLVDRARAIVFHPATEWPLVAAEPSSSRALYLGYVAPLAAIGPIATFVGLSFVGITLPFVGAIRVGPVSGLVQAVLSYAFALVGILAIATIVDALAPSFAGRKDARAALKVTAYSYTPTFVAGALSVFPLLAPLQVLAACYACYLLYLGLPVLMGVPRAKAPGYLAAVVACAIVVGVVFAGVLGTIRATSYASGSALGIGDMSDAARGSKLAATVVGNVLGGGEKNSEAAKTMIDSVASASADADRASKTGDSQAQTAAGVAMLEALVGGGKSVHVVPREVLRTLLPTTIDGMTRTEVASETSTIAGITGSKASVGYRNGVGQLTIEIGDIGNAAGLASIAALAANVSETENDAGYDRNVDDRGVRVHETWRNAGKHSELYALVAHRFALGVTADGLDMGAVRAALDAVDLTKLETLASSR